MNPLLRESAAHLFVESLDAPELTPDDVHHLGRVLRVRPDDGITVSDGDGRWACASFAGAGVTLTSEVVVAERPQWDPRRVIAATPKGDRPELMVQKLTELGIDEICFTTTSRSVVRWDPARAESQLGRLRRVARGAAMQSRRVRLPIVSLVAWNEVVAMPAVAVAEPDGDELDPSVRSIVIGPEGGFTSDESALFAHRVRLGQTILRVETAAIAAGVLLMLGEDSAEEQ